MPDGCSTPKSFRIPCRKRAATLVELGFKCWVLFVANWNELLGLANGEIHQLLEPTLKYPEMKEIERNCTGIMLS